MIRASLIVAALLAASPALAQQAIGWQTFAGQGSAPAAPPPGRYRLYFDGSGNLKWKNSAGTVTTVSTGGGGGGGCANLLACFQAAGSSADNVMLWTPTLGGFVVDDFGSAGTTEDYLGVLFGGSQPLFMVRPYGVVSQYDGIGTNDTLGVWSIENPTAAALGAQQYSPDLRLRGRGWATGASASRTVDFHIQTQPVQGATPTGNLVFSSRINAGSLFTAMSLTSAGVLSLGSGLASGTLITAASLSGTFTGTYTLGGTPTIGSDVTLSAGVDINGSSTSDITGRFLTSVGTKPDCTINTTVNGTGGSCSVTGNAQAGKVTITGGTGGGFAVDGTWFTLTHANSYACANGTAVQFYCADTDCGAATNNYNINTGFYAATTTTTAAFKTTSLVGSHPVNGTAYELFYRIDCYSLFPIGLVLFVLRGVRRQRRAVVACGVIAIALLVGVAHAGVYGRAAFLRYVIGTGASSSDNVASVVKTPATTGTYVVTLTRACSQALGVVNFAANRADGACFGDFTATNAITILCRRASDNALVDIPNGTIVQLVAYCAVP